MKLCSVKGCKNEGAVIHQPTNSVYCDKHWEKLCNDEIKEYKENKSKGQSKD